VLATLTDGAYALSAARMTRGIRRRSSRRLAFVSACAYGVLGVLAIAA
jgi:hypothetical protein